MIITGSISLKIREIRDEKLPGIHKKKIID